MQKQIKLIQYFLILPIFLFANSNPEILAVLTNHQIDNNGNSTGLWFSELTHFYHIFEDTEYSVDFVSPKGGNVPIDPASLTNLDEISLDYHNNSNFMERLKKTPSVNDINVKDYIAIYFAGGHGAMWDFSKNTELEDITREIYEKKGIVSAVCHGTAGLLNTKLSNGKYLIDDKNITGFSNIEESIAGKKSSVPFFLEDAIEDRNANYDKNLIPFTSNVVIDGRIFTGQNPNSTRELAEAILNYLKKNDMMSKTN